MSNGTSAIIILGLALLIVIGGAMFLLLDDVNPQEPMIENNDHIRQIAVASLASSINHYGNQQLVDLIGPDWVHLGNGPDGCPLITPHCQLASKPCLDLSSILNQNLSVPQDHEAEDGMSGYVIRAISSDMVEIKACYTQAEQPIVQRVKVGSNQTDGATSSSESLVGNVSH